MTITTFAVHLWTRDDFADSHFITLKKIKNRSNNLLEKKFMAFISENSVIGTETPLASLQRRHLLSGL